MTQTPAGEFVDDGHCFACGRKNELGLQMRFREEPGRVVCGVILPPWLQGWRGIAHGGAVSLLLDEAMAHAIGHTGFLAATASMSLRFRQPVPVGERVTVRARVIEQRLGAASAEAEVLNAQGEPLASAEAKFMIVGRLAPGAKLGDEADGRG